ncbi:molybdopterin biosynthesis protein MoeB [Pelagophyceae sp. CCMP2097]|nr:molybdopterin biosynthesis protein MoeB [Pelagophyceae sp. CCMP2097]
MRRFAHLAVLAVACVRALQPATSASLSHDEIQRYSRHLILEDVGLKGQTALKNSKVLCIGAGGLGSPALMYLAAAGVGTLTIIDDDTVDVSNLQRQIVHDTASVGVSKAESAKQSLQRINPHVRVHTVQERLTSDNAFDLIAAHDVVLDGSDNFATKYLIDDVCVEAGKPNVYGAILRFEGQCSVFNWPPGVGVTYRDFMPDPPKPNDVPSCAEGGVMGVLPGVIGCLQATETIKLLIGAKLEDTLAGRLVVYDAMKMRFKELKLSRQAERTAVPVPGSQPVDSSRFLFITPEEAATRFAEGWAPYVLDVRLPQEAEICALPFADALCPHRKVASVAESLPRDRDILVHCKSGFRSKLACETLADLGHAGRLFSLDGGIIAWAETVDSRIPIY